MNSLSKKEKKKLLKHLEKKSKKSSMLLILCFVIYSKNENTSTAVIAAATVAATIGAHAEKTRRKSEKTRKGPTRNIDVDRHRVRLIRAAARMRNRRSDALSEMKRTERKIRSELKLKMDLREEEMKMPAIVSLIRIEMPEWTMIADSAAREMNANTVETTAMIRDEEMTEEAKEIETIEENAIRLGETVRRTTIAMNEGMIGELIEEEMTGRIAMTEDTIREMTDEILVATTGEMTQGIKRTIVIETMIDDIRRDDRCKVESLCLRLLYRR